MALNPFYVVAPSIYLPDQVEANPSADASGIVGVHVSEASGVELAVRAGRMALSSNYIVDKCALLAHSFIGYSGHEIWSPAHYVADQLELSSAIPFAVQQVCNGSATALQLVATWLSTTENSDEGANFGVVTSGDAFVDPSFNRWNSDYGVVYGDGGTAAIVSMTRPEGRHLEVVALSHASRSEFESMHRINDALARYQDEYEETSIRANKKSYFEQHGKDAFLTTSRLAITKLIADCLHSAERVLGSKPSVELVYTPRLNSDAINQIYTAPIVHELNGTFDFIFTSARSGHLGSGDMTANLAHLVNSAEQIRENSFALMLSGGAGFSWSAALVRVCE